MTDRKPLLPNRNAQTDFFVCDIFDASPKSYMASMAHPIFSLSTKPDRTVRRYENGDNYVQIAPSHLGLATVHDRDVLIIAFHRSWRRSMKVDSPRGLCVSKPSIC